MNRKALTEEQPFNSFKTPFPNSSNQIPVKRNKIHHDQNENPRKIAKQIYDIRNKRGQLFGSGLFSDPAWDILLDLYLAEEDHKEISITSACIAAGVPTSTGLRWITILIQNGHIERYEDHADARRSFLRLTDTARDTLEALLSPFCGG